MDPLNYGLSRNFYRSSILLQPKQSIRTEQLVSWSAFWNVFYFKAKGDIPYAWEIWYAVLAFFTSKCFDSFFLTLVFCMRIPHKSIMVSIMVSTSHNLGWTMALAGQSSPTHPPAPLQSLKELQHLFSPSLSPSPQHTMFSAVPRRQEQQHGVLLL